MFRGRTGHVGSQLPAKDLGFGYAGRTVVEP